VLLSQERLVLDLWQRLRDYLRREAPAVLESLNPPTSERDINSAEAALGIELPEDLRASLLVHNGQHADVPLIPQEHGRRSEMIATWGELLPLEKIIDSSVREKGFIAAMAADPIMWHFEFHGPVRRDRRWKWIDFVDPGTGFRIALDLNPGPRGKAGQVISILGRPEAIWVLAPSYRIWFEQLVERFESGRYRFTKSEENSVVDVWNPDVEEE
jgi:cell wall assembly regulator SMI1